MPEKTICVVGQTEITCQFIAKELRKYFDNCLNVISWSVEFGSKPSNYQDSDVFITTSEKTSSLIKKYIPSDRKVFIAARTLNLDQIHKLLQLDHGTKAILVQNSYEMALASINIIDNLGIKHIKLIPYYPALSIDITDNIKLAITTGMSSLVPPNIENSIDLGTNKLDFSVYADIVYTLNLPKYFLNNISNNYIEKILSITIESLNTSKDNQKLRSRLEVILNTVNESIIAINEDKKIIAINPIAEKTLGVKKDIVLNKDVNDIFPQFEIDIPLHNGKNVIDEIKKINNKHYVITKNIIFDENEKAIGVVATIRPATEVQELETKIRQTLKKKGHIAKYHFKNILGYSDNLLNTINIAKKFAKTDLNILLVGESGTGKELFAQSIHNYSNRIKQPFVASNFAALSPTLVESELFGFEEGAFTGAKKGGKIGLFEAAHTGTIFLDEIGDVSLDLQKKILRVLEEREVRRIGGNTLTPINVRVISATNRNLEELVEEGLFRSDLFFRLCTLPIKIPPLRNRGNDILYLIDYFSKTNYHRKLKLKKSMIDFILNYQWPGNIRELENIVNYMCNTTPIGSITNINNLPYYMHSQLNNINANAEPSSAENDTIINELKSQGNFKLVYLILNEINKVSSINKGLGRLKIKQRIELLGYNISESKIKYLLKNLNQLEYITTGTTKQGSKITRKGKKFLLLMEKER